MRAFSRIPARIAPPNFAIPRHLERKNLAALTLVQAIKEVIEVHLVWHFTHHTIEHQKPINATPEKHPIIIHHALRRDDRGIGGNHIKLEYRGTARERGTNNRVKRPKNARRGAARTGAERHALNNLLAPHARQTRSRARQISRLTSNRPPNNPVRPIIEQIRMQRDYPTSRIGIRRQRY